jgi:hypothetical protein
MSAAVAWLIAELIKITLQRIEGSGKFNSLTQAEADQMVVTLTAALSTTLPSPTDLEG